MAIARGPRMQMFSMFSNKPDPATNLAKTPALDKTKSDEEWAAILNPTTFKVLRRKATEPRGVTVSRGGWDNHFEKGTYVCSGCKTPLYTSEHKFDCGACARWLLIWNCDPTLGLTSCACDVSGCGWPGFWSNIKDAVYEEADADGFRCEILCSGVRDGGSQRACVSLRLRLSCSVCCVARCRGCRVMVELHSAAGTCPSVASPPMFREHTRSDVVDLVLDVDD